MCRMDDLYGEYSSCPVEVSAVTRVESIRCLDGASVRKVELFECLACIAVVHCVLVRSI